MNEQTNYPGKIGPSAWRPFFLVATLLVAVGAAGQVPGKAPTLSIAPVPLTTAQRAQATMVDLNFRVPPGYHINSNTPKSEFLIPTALKMDLPTDIILGKIEYPAGEDASFPLLAKREIERLQRRLHHRCSRPPTALGRTGKI